MRKVEMPYLKKEVKKTPRKKQERSFIEISPTNIAEMIWNSAGKFLQCNLETMEINKVNEIGNMIPFDSDIIRKGVVLFPTTAEDFDSDAKLIEEIQEFIHKYVDVSPFFEKLSAYYILFTWVYDNFNTLPYLRVMGDYGSGKTRFLQTIGSICYKPMFAGGATTPSPIFRIINMFNGTLVLDEADFKISEEWADIIKILNCGFQKGFPVLRTEEKDGKREPVAYDCYCPKILATRREFKDRALESRCLTEKVMETARSDIPLILGPEFFEESAKIRNNLLMFRFKHYGKHKIDFSQQDKTIEKRLNQVIIPIYSIIENDDIRQEIRGFLREYNKKLISERGEQFEAMILENIFDILQNRIDDDRINEKLYVKMVVDRINETIIKPEDKFTPHKIGWLIRKKLYLDMKKDRQGRWINWNVDIFYKLIKKYGVCDDATFVTFTRETSEKVTRTKDTTLRDDYSVSPVD